MTNPDEPPRRIIQFYFEPADQDSVDTRVFIEARRCIPHVIDIRWHAPPEWALRKALQQYGVAEVLNKKAPKFRELGLAKKEVTEDEAVQLIQKHTDLIKRPVCLYETQVTVGLDKDRLLKMCGGKPAIGQVGATQREKLAYR